MSVNLCPLYFEDERNTFEVYVTVTDTRGLSSTDFIRTRPNFMNNTVPVASFSVNALRGSPPFFLATNALASFDAESGNLD
jgi:hypothetical protein